MNFFSRTLVGPPGGDIEQHEAAEIHMLRRRERVDGGSNRNRRGLALGISECPR